MAVLLGTPAPGVAHAAPPDNDDFDASTPITALPFTTQSDRTEATRGPDDPTNCVGRPAEGSVWFHHTATESGIVRVDTNGSDLDVKLSVLIGTRGDLRSLGCSGPGGPLTLRVTAGQTYYFMAADGYDGRGAGLNLSVQRMTPVANDDFADAQPVTSLPFSAPQPDFTLAGAEPEEPWATECAGVREGAPTVWFSYTPTRTESVLARVRTDGAGPVLSVYEGSSLPELRSLGCAEGHYWDGKAFRLVAGTTYHLQLQYSFYSSAEATVVLEEAPPLETELTPTSSGEWSTFQDIDFRLYHRNDYDQPVTAEWDFGDGTSVPPSTEEQAVHRYAEDGDYTVTVRSTSADGRVATDAVPVVVKTHDVGIAKFTTPSSVRAGQQKQLSVQVSNTRYLEKDTAVTLYKYGQWGWEEVGLTKLDVPAHPTRKVTFPFAYTFTQEDAIRGKVTFRAVVSLPYPSRDALPLDNEVISTATTVLPAATTTALVN
ncbi:PKD domain-containing protein [Actinosynnema sp. CA-299493]